MNARCTGRTRAAADVLESNLMQLQISVLVCACYTAESQDAIPVNHWCCTRRRYKKKCWWRGSATTFDQKARHNLQIICICILQEREKYMCLNTLNLW